MWERSDAIGGGLALAGAAPHRDGWLRMIEFYGAALEDEKLELRLGAEPDAAALASFDAIVIASGAEELLPGGAAAGFARTASAAIAAGPESLAGVSHLVVVDDGFGWWPAVSAVELGIAAGASTDHDRHSGYGVRDGDSRGEPDSTRASPAWQPDRDATADRPGRGR